MNGNRVELDLSELTNVSPEQPKLKKYAAYFLMFYSDKKEKVIETFFDAENTVEAFLVGTQKIIGEFEARKEAIPQEILAACTLELRIVELFD